MTVENIIKDMGVVFIKCENQGEVIYFLLTEEIFDSLYTGLETGHIESKMTVDEYGFIGEIPSPINEPQSGSIIADDFSAIEEAERPIIELLIQEL